VTTEDPDNARIKAEWQHIVDVVRPKRLFAYIDKHYDTVAQFADVVGIAPTSVSRMRIGARGRKKIGEETAFLIERKLKLPRGFLDNEIREGIVEPPAPAWLSELDHKTIETVRRLQSIEEPMRQLITALIDYTGNPPDARDRRAVKKG